MDNFSFVAIVIYIQPDTDWGLAARALAELGKQLDGCVGLHIDWEHDIVRILFKTEAAARTAFVHFGGSDAASVQPFSLN